MKRLKRVTKREKKAMEKFLKELKEKEPAPVETVAPKKARPVTPIFSLKNYFAAKAKKRLEKLTLREENRQAKADKIAVRAKLKAAKKAARDEKEAKRAARLAKKQELSTK